MAARTGTVDGLWWTEHDWRLVNFAKLRSLDLDALTETARFPARVAEADQPPAEIECSWEPLESPADGVDSEAVVGPPGAGGTDSLGLSAATGGDPAVARWELDVDNYRATYPLFSRPELRLAVHPDGCEGGGALVELVLSEQPPEMDHAHIRYVLGDAPPTEPDGPTVTRHLDAAAGEWTDLVLDPATDATDLGLPADGLDNSLHRIRLGVTTPGPERTAHFDALRIRPERRGPELLDIQRELLDRLPTEVEHFVGMEVSWYGQHVNAFGADVPVPDYWARDPDELDTAGIVDHIHEHGGVACYNHPSTGDVTAHADRLIETDACGVELMEVGRRDAPPADRLDLWDRVSAAGVVLTGLGVGDIHHTAPGWEAGGDRAPYFVTHVWADTLEANAVLDALTAGRAYVASPGAFDGTVDIEGPDGLRMGGVAVDDGECRLAATVDGAEAGDRLVWRYNGDTLESATVDAPEVTATVTVPAGEPVRAVRVELRRSGVSPEPVALSNPVYLVDSADRLSPQGRDRLG